MAARFVFRFAWTEAKATANRRKHGIEFKLAATVFLDPLTRTRYDDEHSENEERWVTLGLAEDNTLLVVVHTLEELAENQAWVRIISARVATGPERKQYQSDR